MKYTKRVIPPAVIKFIDPTNRLIVVETFGTHGIMQSFTSRYTNPKWDSYRVGQVISIVVELDSEKPNPKWELVNVLDEL